MAWEVRLCSFLRRCGAFAALPPLDDGSPAAPSLLGAAGGLHAWCTHTIIESMRAAASLFG